MGKCKIDLNNPKGAKCLKNFSVLCVGRECENYACTNFERIMASPEALSAWLTSVFSEPLCRSCALQGEDCYSGECADGVAKWLDKPVEEE